MLKLGLELKEISLSGCTIVELKLAIKLPPGRPVMHQTGAIVLLRPRTVIFLPQPENVFTPSVLEEGSKADGAVETLRAIPHA